VSQKKKKKGHIVAYSCPYLCRIFIDFKNLSPTGRRKPSQQNAFIQSKPILPAVHQFSGEFFFQ